MGTLKRVAFLVLCFGAASVVASSGQPRAIRVEVMGELQVYDSTGLICDDARDETTLTFAPGSQNLRFDGQTDEFDQNCMWIGDGSLIGDEANLRLEATFRDFVQFRPTEPIGIVRADSGPSGFVRVDEIRVILYSPERYRREMRALANEAISEGDWDRAIDWYDEALLVGPDSDTLRMKADALDRAGRYVEAATTWNQYSGMVLNDSTGESSARNVGPWRWISSLYRAADSAPDTMPETWLHVARAARSALDLGLVRVVDRPQVMGMWLDSLFRAAGSEGDYSTLADGIVLDENVRGSWEALYYGEFRGNLSPGTVRDSYEDAMQHLEELERALGRKAVG